MNQDNVGIAGEQHLQGHPYRTKVMQRQQILDRINAIRELPRLNEMTSHQLEAKLFVLERQYDAFGELQTELELMDDRELSHSHREIFEESFCAAKALIIERMQFLNPPRREGMLHSTMIPNGTSMANMASAPRVHLPKIPLTKFNGEPRDWIDFYNVFCVLVHNNNELSNIEKFQYLRSCLVDTAARLVNSLEVTEHNYVKALDLLRSRYGNKRLMFQAHLHHMFMLQATTKSSASALREFIDVVNTNLRAMESFASTQQIAEGIILHLITSKLDTENKAKWEEEITNSFDRNSTVNSILLPTWDDLAKFLERRCQIADIIETDKRNSKNSQSVSITSNNRSKRDSKHSFVAAQQAKCIFCNAIPQHTPFKCDSLMEMDPLERYKCAKRLNLCINCLKSGHKSMDCPSGACRTCHAKHHTLLHREVAAIEKDADEVTPDRAVFLSSTALKVSVDKFDAILGTALIQIFNSRGVNIHARALLDSGSQLHFITERIAQHLRVSRKAVHLNVSGIGLGATTMQYACSITIKSRHSDYSAVIDAVIIPTITTCQPSQRIETTNLNIPTTIIIADPTFNIPGPVDILIGAGLFFELLGKSRISLQGPVLQDTKLGWIVAGAFPCDAAISSRSALSKSSYKSLVACTSESTLEDMLEKFWLIEELPSQLSSNQSSDEIECENYFQKTTRRCPTTNKFIVRLPFREDPNNLGESEAIACRRMYSLEYKFTRNPSLWSDYSNFIKEYADMQHMVLVQSATTATRCRNFIPHHAVSKLDSSTTKLRVVFDASCKTTNGKSLNDVLRVGPTLQDDIFTSLSRFRRHKYVLIADIAKMYRQILVDEEDAKWQCILWRSSPDQPMSAFQLQTVTYGTSCAPYLAVKCLQQLAIDEASIFPVGSAVTLRDFYVDNLITGADTIQEVIEIKQQTTLLLQRGGFPLRKFASNEPCIIEDIPPEDKEDTIRFDDTEFIKTLGLRWSPSDDCLIFSFKPKGSTALTKRSILSNLASFFDPLGLLNPLIVSCKILMQQLWKLKLTWDQEVPATICVQWEQFYNQLDHLRALKISRYVPINNDTNFHVFADASTKAYGACVYAVWTTPDGPQSSLLCAKSRVAPTKEISLPRLELCAALLATELVSQVVKIFDLTSTKFHCWSDSTITLAWIAGEPSRWNVFVANRVTKIQQLGTNSVWGHVPTELNPADMVSRGANASDMLDNSLWWHGPQFICYPQNQWPSASLELTDPVREERRKRVCLVASQMTDLVSTHKYANNYLKLIRIFAYINRFVNGRRNQLSFTDSFLVSPSEQESALLLICSHIQQISFSDDYNRLRNGKEIDRRSKLLSLSPFMHNKIIRVGGRLANSSLPFDSKHPILLPPSHPFTTSLIRHNHYRHMHAGTQTLQSILRDKFWILNSRNAVRRIVHSCIRCFRCNPRTAEQIMGNLPADRVTRIEPFEVTGVDYCGPIPITQQIRGRPPIKTYIAVFICFTTKAVHLELVPDLSTQAFISALKRFIARRGMCRKLYSDNATNFVGANRELKALLSEFTKNTHIEQLQRACLDAGIEWHFIPPRSPHFGGLWESAVKMAKYYLRRAIGSNILTHEELHTVCCQAEAIINSRPLTPMSNDPNDLRPLTPAHFVVGRQLTTIPDSAAAQVPSSSLKRYQLIQLIQHQFWHRWQREYLNHLQQRTKWKFSSQNLKIGELVLLKAENMPPLKWPIGRIVETMPGEDGFIRVAMVKTSDGTHKRSINKLCKLPITVTQ